MKPLPTKATHQQTKAYNSQLVLKTIYVRGEVSRAEVARQTNLTRTTVSDLVNELLERGLVEEVGRGPSAVGKSPIMLSVVKDARHVVALDLANEVFVGALVNLRGEICRRIELPLRGRGGEAAVALVFELIDALLASTHQPLLGIGVGTPGLIDTKNGLILQAVNLDWQNLPLGQLLTERYNLPVYIANDCQVTAMAQYLFNSEQKTENLVAVKLGQGVGSGIVLNGQLFQGDGFGAGEIGHVAVADNGVRCRCGNLGCLETVTSERAIIRQAQDLAREDPHSRLNQLASRPEEITLETVFGAYQAGDEGVRRIVLEAGRYLGIAAAAVVGALNINHIWLTGRITQFGADWLAAVRESLRQHTLSALANQTQVEISSLNGDLVVLGASALLIMRELGLDLAR